MTTARTRGRPRTKRQTLCADCGQPSIGLRCRDCWAKHVQADEAPTADRPEGAAARGPIKGSKARLMHEHVCPLPDCPRHGVPFMGTAKRLYCSRGCNRRAQTIRDRGGVEVYAFPDSSNIGVLQYTPAETKLLATFHDGRAYNYSGVSPEIWRRLLEEDRSSIGGAFARLIRGTYEPTRTEERPSYEPVTVSASARSVAPPGGRDDADVPAVRQ